MKKKLFGLLACVMMFALALGIVACGETPENKDADTYTVTFVNGEQTVKTSSVEKGKALAAADFPADPTAPANKTFDGWYVGEEKLSVGFVPEADITANAQFKSIYYTVTFVVGENTVKTVTVEAGTKPAASDLPNDPDKEHYTFDGWFDSEGNEFDEDAVVTASATYTAKFSQEDYIVTFVQDGQADKTAWAVKQQGKTSGKLADIPTPEAVAGGDGVFVGWFKDGVKATADLEITEDTTFHAAYAKEEDYTGVWYNDEEKLRLRFEEDSIIFGKETFAAGEYKSAEGTFVSEEQLSADVIKYRVTFTVAIDKIVVEYYHDLYGSYDYYETETYILTKAEGEFALAGTYRKAKQSTDLEIDDYGFVTTFGSPVYYGRLVANGTGSYDLAMYTGESSDVMNIAISVDTKNNLIITNDEDNSYKAGLFVKYSSGDTIAEYSCSGEYLYVHTLSGTPLYVYSESDTANYYVTIQDGTFAVGNIITFARESDPSVTYLVKIVSTSQFALAGAERGTYTLEGSASLTLDGFDKATLGDASPVDYYIVGNKVVAGANGYQINTADSTYTTLVKESGNHVGTFTNIKSATYTATFDGYGIVIEKYTSTSSNYVYYGTYTIGGTTLTIEGLDDIGSYYLTNGTYTLAEDEKVIYNESEKTVYAKADYELYSKLDQFTGDHDGYWTKDGGEGEYIEITINDKKITKLDYNGTLVTSNCAVRFDGSKITIDGSGLKVALTIDDSKLHVVSTDEGGINDTYTSTPKPVTEKDAFAGGWVGKVPQSSSKDTTYWFDGFGNGIQTDGTSYSQFNYSVKGNTIEFILGDNTFSLELKGEKLEGHFEYDYEEYPVSLSKGRPDKFAGVWTAEGADYILTFTGYGYVIVAKGDVQEIVKYTTKNEDTAEFAIEDYSNAKWSCTLQPNGTLKVTSFDSDGYSGDVNADFTLEGGTDELDALAGSWVSGLWTFTFDGKGEVTVKNAGGQGTTSYNFDGTNLTFSYSNCEFTGTYRDGQLELSCDDDEFFASTTLTKS